MSKLYMDPVFALAHLADRAGARGLEVGWSCPHTPGEPDGHSCEQVTWAAHATYQGARVQTAGHRTPNGAALDLAEWLLTGGMCRCRRPVVLADGVEGCRWQLMGQRWTPGCDAKPITVQGARGDLTAMHAAAAGQQQGNRAQRRAGKKRQGAHGHDRRGSAPR
jgi:hypothetical protein